MSRVGVSRRSVLAGQLAAAAGGLLAACTPGGRAAQPEGAAKPAGEIEFWQGWSTRTPQLRAYLDRFEQEHPGTKVVDQPLQHRGGLLRAAPLPRAEQRPL
jgi:ABC-type glycerol-3-phosphate transport system substrate-binding protein